MPLVTVDSVGAQVEVTVWPSSDSGGLSVLMAPADWAAVCAAAEQLEPVRAWRQREARLAGSHHEARASRR